MQLEMGQLLAAVLAMPADDSSNAAQFSRAIFSVAAATLPLAAPSTVLPLLDALCDKARHAALHEPDDKDGKVIRAAGLSLVMALVRFVTAETHAQFAEHVHALLPVLLLHVRNPDEATRSSHAAALAAVGRARTGTHEARRET